MAKVDEKRRLEILNGNMWKIITVHFFRKET